jgi:HD-GYP domain-containing protein (c-di-GMP phosphodiesterase class II)
MSDSRTLLNRIAEFRKRLEKMPRLSPSTEGQTPSTQSENNESEKTRQDSGQGLPPPHFSQPQSISQAIVTDSLRQLNITSQDFPTELSDPAKRYLQESLGLVSSLRAAADDLLIVGPAADSQGKATGDLLAGYFRETAALTEAAVRYAQALPSDLAVQERLCEGLEQLVRAARRNFRVLVAAAERRREEENRVNILARFLVATAKNITRDPQPILEFAKQFLHEEAGVPLRVCTVSILSTQAHLGGVEYPAPARFIAAHSLNRARILVRMIVHSAEWTARAEDVVLAGLLADVGMLEVPLDLLAQSESWTGERHPLLLDHPIRGAEKLLQISRLGHLSEAIHSHHERMDGTGYPKKLSNGHISPLARLVAVADEYAARLAPRPYRLGYDPRTILADVLTLASQGKLDRSAAQLLTNLGLYPVGTAVLLNDQRKGVVVALPQSREWNLLGKPTVALLTDSSGRAYLNPKYLDLAQTSQTILRSLSAEERVALLARNYPEWL